MCLGEAKFSMMSLPPLFLHLNKGPSLWGCLTRQPPTPDCCCTSQSPHVLLVERCQSRPSSTELGAHLPAWRGNCGRGGGRGGGKCVRLIVSLNWTDDCWTGLNPRFACRKSIPVRQCLEQSMKQTVLFYTSFLTLIHLHLTADCLQLTITELQISMLCSQVDAHLFHHGKS